jgi:hypothetical protein
MREDHGVTVPLSSFRTRDAVQGRKRTSAKSTEPSRRSDGPLSQQLSQASCSSQM